ASGTSVRGERCLALGRAVVLGRVLQPNREGHPQGMASMIGPFTREQDRCSKFDQRGNNNGPITETNQHPPPQQSTGKSASTKSHNISFSVRRSFLCGGSDTIKLLLMPSSPRRQPVLRLIREPGRSPPPGGHWRRSVRGWPPQSGRWSGSRVS